MSSGCGVTWVWGLQVVMTVVWLHQWIVDRFLPMLPVLGALSAWTFVLGIGGFIARSKNVPDVIALSETAALGSRAAFTSGACDPSAP